MFDLSCCNLIMHYQHELRILGRFALKLSRTLNVQHDTNKPVDCTVIKIVCWKYTMKKRWLHIKVEISNSQAEERFFRSIESNSTYA